MYTLLSRYNYVIKQFANIVMMKCLNDEMR